MADFLVAELASPCGHCDSYVLRLDDPVDVASARAWLAQGPASGVGSIAVARIAAGADGVNRDLLAPGSPPWSWHLTDFQGFAHFTIELCDGWPGYVESDVAGWIANTNGTICFWSYAVKAELAQAPLAPAPWLLPVLLLTATLARARRART